MNTIQTTTYEHNDCGQLVKETVTYAEVVPGSLCEGAVYITREEFEELLAYRAAAEATFRITHAAVSA